MSRRTLELVRCDRCGDTLYAKPNGISVGETCGADIPAEWVPMGKTMLSHVTHCPGRFQTLGRLQHVR